MQQRARTHQHQIEHMRAPARVSIYLGLTAAARTQLPPRLEARDAPRAPRQAPHMHARALLPQRRSDLPRARRCSGGGRPSAAVAWAPPWARSNPPRAPQPLHRQPPQTCARARPEAPDERAPHTRLCQAWHRARAPRRPTQARGVARAVHALLPLRLLARSSHPLPPCRRSRHRRRSRCARFPQRRARACARAPPATCLCDS